MILTATGETIFMTFIPLVLSYLFGIPLAFVSVETAPLGLYPNVIVNKILQVVIAIGRAIPFVILMVLVLPLTRLLIGTGIGTVAVIVPLTICAIPFVTRIIETSLNKIDRWTILASKIDNASKFKIMFKIKFLSILPELVDGIGITAIAILGYTTMAGTVGGGGLGNYAIVYGFQRYDWLSAFYATLIIVGLVLIIQFVCVFISRLLKNNLFGRSVVDVNY